MMHASRNRNGLEMKEEEKEEKGVDRVTLRREYSSREESLCEAWETPSAICGRVESDS